LDLAEGSDRPGLYQNTRARCMVHDRLHDAGEARLAWRYRSGRQGT